MQKLLYTVGGLFSVLIAIGLALPRHAVVSATTRIDAKPATVFALVNDFRRVALWSPWLNSDPNARIVYSGPVRGTNTAMTWDGAIIGSGSQVITESRPFSYVGVDINGGEPGAAKSWFDLQDDSDMTIVRWTYSEDYGYNLVGRYFALLLTGVIERDYNEGLVSLKEFAETLPRADFSDLEIEHMLVEALDIAYLPTTSRPEPGAISKAMGDAYFEILGFIDANALQEAGAPLSITRSYSGAELVFDTAIPVRGITDTTPRDNGGVQLGLTYAGPVIRIKHTGAYRTLSATHRKIVSYLAALGIERNGDAWESYVSDPTKVPEDKLLTYVYYPIRESA